MIQVEVKVSEPITCPVCSKALHAYRFGWPAEYTYILECSPCNLRTSKRETLAAAQREAKHLHYVQRRAYG